MKTILILGDRGQVGWELSRALLPLGKIIALDKTQLDLANSQAILNKLEEIQPDIIVNAAAYTAVDKAESERELAFQINAKAPGILAAYAKKKEALLIHYSTDYVFDGLSPIPMTEKEITNPLNVYGLSKLEGEKSIQSHGCKHLIFRTSWVYGSRGKNFLLTMLKLGKEQKHLNIVHDQIGAPTWSRLIAETTGIILAKLPYLSNVEWGIYNLTASERTSWKGFAESIFHFAHLQNPAFQIPTISGIPSSDYPVLATRPKNSALSLEKIQTTFDLSIPSWKECLKLCLKEVQI